jgi:plastocyanin
MADSIATPYVIEIRQHAFNPAELRIKVGDAVVWHNNDHVNHSAMRDNDPQFDTGLLSFDKRSAPVSFSQASPADGFDYHCDPHPDMVGVIIVAAADVPKPKA